LKPNPPLDPPVADEAPDVPAYDEEQLVVYLRLLDAEFEGADWKGAALYVLNIDADREHDRAWRDAEAHT
jgi:hypothetical protein